MKSDIDAELEYKNFCLKQFSYYHLHVSDGIGHQKYQNLKIW